MPMNRQTENGLVSRSHRMSCVLQERTLLHVAHMTLNGLCDLQIQKGDFMLQTKSQIQYGVLFLNHRRPYLNKKLLFNCLAGTWVTLLRYVQTMTKLTVAR